MNVASLCCGAGGLDLGFQAAGGHIGYSCDTDDASRRTFARNLGVAPLNRDVRLVRASNLAGADAVVAGPPCQGFSSINSRSDSDPRNDLFLVVSKLIAKAKPAVFVMENVTGIAWRDGGAFMDKALRTLNTGGLSAVAIPVDCAALGLAQRRRRILIVGGHGHHGSAFLRSLKQRLALPRRRTTVGEVLLPVPRLGSLPNHEPKSSMPGWYGPVLKAVRPGQKLCDTRLGSSSIHSWDVPEVFGQLTPADIELLELVVRLRRSTVGRRYRHIGDGRPIQVRRLCEVAERSSSAVLASVKRALALDYLEAPRSGYIDLARRFNGRFKRLDPDNVSPAVTKEFGHARNIVHPTLDRGLTVRECARLQGFSDSFVFDGTQSDQYRQVANAFPPPLSLILGEAAAQVLASKRRGRRNG